MQAVFIELIDFVLDQIYYKIANPLDTGVFLFSGEKPYVCQYCGVAYSSMLSCKNHEQTHSNSSHQSRSQIHPQNDQNMQAAPEALGDLGTSNVQRTHNFACQCGLLFNDFAMLKEHENMFHTTNDTMTATITQQYTTHLTTTTTTHSTTTTTH